jgi:hypothetical protein
MELSAYHRSGARAPQHHIKDNAVYKVVRRNRKSERRNILRDETIRLTGVGAEDKCPFLLRFNLLTYRDPWAWLNAPFQTPIAEPGGIQLDLWG